MKLGIIAGEASGNILGAGLLRTLRQQEPNLKAYGIGGPDMIAYGCNSLYDMERLSVMGLVEPLKRLPELFNIRRSLYQHFLENRPDVFIGIDSPDFNLGLEKKLRAAGIPVIHYVSPSVWAWRQKRIFKIAKAVDLVLTLFPFEKAFYDQHAVPAEFVGHPLADLIPLTPDKAGARANLGLEPDAVYIAVLPGSRRNELKFLAETFVAAAKLCWQEQRELRFITNAANATRNKEFQHICHQIAPDLPITFFEGKSHDVMAASDIILVTSGTATLEAMLFKRPMVIAYKMANLTYQIARHIVKIPHMGLPNLLANERLVPEFVQNEVTPKALAEAVLAYLDDPAKTQALTQTFHDIHLQLRCDANQKAAASVINLIKSTGCLS